MDLTKMSSRSKRLAISMVTILFMLWLTQPYISKWTGSTKSTPVPETNMPVAHPTVVMPVENTASDPFRDHVRQNGFSNKANIAPDSGTSFAAGVDPFKAHLEVQKEQAKNSGVSPFGK